VVRTRKTYLEGNTSAAEVTGRICASPSSSEDSPSWLESVASSVADVVGPAASLCSSSCSSHWPHNAAVFLSAMASTSSPADKYSAYFTRLPRCGRGREGCFARSTPSQIPSCGTVRIMPPSKWGSPHNIIHLSEFTIALECKSRLFLLIICDCWFCLRWTTRRGWKTEEGGEGRG